MQANSPSVVRLSIILQVTALFLPQAVENGTPSFCLQDLVLFVLAAMPYSPFVQTSDNQLPTICCAEGKQDQDALRLAIHTSKTVFNFI